MSYDFAAVGAKIKGSLTTALDDNTAGMTLACWVKEADRPATPVNTYLALSVSENSNTDGRQRVNSTEGATDSYQGQSRDTGGVNGAQWAATAGEFDNTWLPIVFTVTSPTDRSVYVNAIGNTAQNGSSRDVDPCIWTTIGMNPSGSEQSSGLLAECAIWDRVLTAQEITDFLAGEPASTIAASNLRGYWPLNQDNTTQANEGLDATGDLAVTLAVYDIDHPPVSGDLSAPVNNATMPTQYIEVGTPMTPFDVTPYWTGNPAPTYSSLDLPPGIVISSAGVVSGTPT